MHIPGLDDASDDERLRAEAAGLPVPDEALCWTARDPEGAPVAFVVLLPGEGERRVRAVAATSTASPATRDAVVAAREAVLAALAAAR